MEEVVDKHLKPILEVLDSKNIDGVKLIKQSDKIMLLLDKRKLNEINLYIMNAMNLVYPNDIICINDENNPFDYEELYEMKPEKINRKVRPYDIFAFSMEEQEKPTEYFKQYLFAGIELDTTRLNPVMQLGYFLEFVNAFQEQNPLEGEKVEVKKGVEVYSEEQLRRYQHYINQGHPDKKGIVLFVAYNEDIEEKSENELKLRDDPYFYRHFMKPFRQEKSATTEKIIVKLTPERLLNNVQGYIKSKRQNKVNKNQIDIEENLLKEIEMLRD